MEKICKLSPDETADYLNDKDKFDINSTDDELYLKSLESKIKKCISEYPLIKFNEIFARVSSKTKAGIKPTFISREDSFLQKIPLVPQKVHINSSINLHSVKREPKFVPYEPYKACVRYILTEEVKGISKNTIKAKKISRIKASERKQNFISSSDVKEKTNEGKELVDLKVEVKSLQNEIFSLNQILATQSQVNNDLKKLLVASLGEDVQEKVQCLTEERARMAKMIRKYSEKVDLDYEEKERISIQCDVWKSKFHASSLILDELSENNRTINNYLREASEALNMMLEERNVSYPLLLNAYKHTYQVQEAFDPLHSQCTGSDSLLSTDSLSLSVAISSLAENVRNRLVGTLGLVTKGVPLPSETKTPGENVALQVLKNCKAYLIENASLPIAGRSILSSKFGIDKRLTINCCAHCNGEIILV